MAKNPIYIGMQTDRGACGVQIGRQLAFTHGIVQGQPDAVIAVEGCSLTLAPHVTHFISEFALMKQNFINATGFRVQCNLMKQMNQQFSHAAQRVDFVFTFAGFGHFIERLMQAVEHRLNQIRLIAKVPINSATSHTRKLGDVRERGTGHPPLIERVLGSFQNLASGFLSFLFGATNHGSKTSIKMSQTDDVYRPATAPGSLCIALSRTYFHALPCWSVAGQGIYKQP